MTITRSIPELQLDRAKRIGLVPTMGALHEGHLSLIRTARANAEVVVMSLFVNPTQFKAGEDFEKYPRDEKRDFSLAEEAGADIVFAPTTDEMYPHRDTLIHVSGVSERWEGVHRPGHFDGVATVVAKLFNIIGPDVAVFGQKDYQQCVVIGQMVEDLNFKLELVFAETVREPDGLAMSSRNTYLSREERTIAPLLHRELADLALLVRSAEGPEQVERFLNKSITKLTRSGFKVDYLELVEPKSLLPKREVAGRGRLIVAAKLGSTRLIDNVEA